MESAAAPPPEPGSSPAPGSPVPELALDPREAEARAIAHRYVEAFNERDLEAMLSVVDENVTSRPSALFERRPAYTGHAGVREWWETMTRSGRAFRVVVDDVRRLDDDRWAILGEVAADGETVSPWTLVFRLRDGLIVESHSYLSDRALLRQLGVLG